MYLSIVIGTGCSGYCLLALSVQVSSVKALTSLYYGFSIRKCVWKKYSDIWQAAVSYAVGVLFRL